MLIDIPYEPQAVENNHIIGLTGTLLTELRDLSNFKQVLNDMFKVVKLVSVSKVGKERFKKVNLVSSAHDELDDPRKLG